MPPIHPVLTYPLGHITFTVLSLPVFRKRFNNSKVEVNNDCNGIYNKSGHYSKWKYYETRTIPRRIVLCGGKFRSVSPEDNSVSSKILILNIFWKWNDDSDMMIVTHMKIKEHDNVIRDNIYTCFSEVRSEHCCLSSKRIKLLGIISISYYTNLLGSIEVQAVLPMRSQIR